MPPASTLLRSTSLTSRAGSVLRWEPPPPPPPGPAPLESILKEISAALGAKLYHVALASALSIPHVCASLECDPKKVWTTEKSYLAWFDAYLAKHFTWLAGLDCVRLRNGVLHTGTLGHPKKRYGRLMFAVPPTGIEGEFLSVNNGGVEETCLTISLRTFCIRMMQAAREWAVVNTANPNVQANLPNLVRLRPEGLAPHVVGAPVIA